jgi:hypothetical protein
MSAGLPRFATICRGSLQPGGKAAGSRQQNFSRAEERLNRNIAAFRNKGSSVSRSYSNESAVSNERSSRLWYRCIQISKDVNAGPVENEGE